MRNATLWVVALAGVGLAGVTILQARSPERARSAAPAAEAPSRGVAAEGRVVAYPGREVVVGTERAGRLVHLTLEEGQAVARGDLLAELDSDELRAALAEDRARVTEAEADVRLAESTLKRRAELTAEGIVAAHELDQAQRDLDIARARLETGRAAVSRDEAQLRKTRILAPISGTVTGRHAQAGETLEAGQRVLTLADLTRLRIEAEADEADADALGVGAPVSITCEAFPGRAWRGRVEDIPRSVTLRRLKPQDPGRPTDTRILAVKVAFAEPTPLKLGATVELKIAALGR
jgi:RND family efflux transporter MFP subunit